MVRKLLCFFKFHKSFSWRGKIEMDSRMSPVSQQNMTEKRNAVRTAPMRYYSPILGLFLGLVLLVLGYCLKEKGADTSGIQGDDAIFLSMYILFGKFSYLYSGLFFLISIVSLIWRSIRKKKASPVKGRKSSSDLQGVAWKEFRDYIICLFEKLGYSLDGDDGLNDKRADLKLKNNTGTSLVCCKKYYVRKIPVSMVFEFYTSMINEPSIEQGYFITTGIFTQEAKKFAEGKPLVLIDGERLMDFVRIVESIGATEERLSIQSNLNKTDHTCPMCGAHMLLRTVKSGSNTLTQFWGCSAYPACKGPLLRERVDSLYSGY